MSSQNPEVQDTGIHLKVDEEQRRIVVVSGLMFVLVVVSMFALISALFLMTLQRLDES